jgi:hypothetical protein
VNDLVVISSNLYVATDVGVYNSSDGGATWRAPAQGLPNVPVTDLEYQVSGNSLYAATFGRGMFMLRLQ